MSVFQTVQTSYNLSYVLIIKFTVLYYTDMKLADHYVTLETD